jgi:TonB-dependent receptor
MRFKILALSTASFAAFTVAAPAMAQDAQAPVDPNVQAQTVPVDPAQGAPQTDDAVAGEGEEIVVTGLRRSLQSAQNLKRNSDQIVDAVVAEDIGKLPDRTVSEALARIPGVTVEREQAEAGDVFVRGLRDPATTYAGREIFTAEARNVAPQDFPAGSVAALEVFKSLTAEQVEGNLAGLINVRPRRPFDFRNPEVAGAFNVTYSDQAKDYAWNGNLLLTDRFETSIGEIGVLVNVSNTELSYKDNVRFVSGDFFGVNPRPGSPGQFEDEPPFDAIAGNVRLPVGVGFFQGVGTRERPSVNGAIQWGVTDDLQIYVEGLYQAFRRERQDRQLFVPLFAGSNYTNVVTGENGAGFADSVNVANPAAPDGFQGNADDRTDTYQIAIGSVYDTNALRFSADLARTDSVYDLSVIGVDFALNRRPTSVTADFDSSEGDGGAQFQVNGLDLANLNNYLFRGLFERNLVAEGDGIQARADLTIKDVAPFIRGIDVGVRYADRNAAYREGSRYSGGALDLGIPYGSLPLSFGQFGFEFRDDVQNGFSLPLPTFGSIRSSIQALRNVVAPFFPAFATQGTPGADPLISYSADEKSYAGYGQVRWGFEGPLTIDGVIGVRAVRTDFSLDGTSLINNVLTPLEVENAYTDYLPNVSARIEFARGLQLRGAYTQTRRRPDFNQLNPGLVIDPPAGAGQVRTGRGGNPNLRPVTSDNYDLSLEYYFNRSGFAALALFRRDVEDFIISAETVQNVPGVGPVRVFGPSNVGDGRLQGVEAQFRTFFDLAGLPAFLAPFGTELNVTYIDQELGDVSFPEVSKWSYNLVGFYEQGPLTARLAYNYRSRYSQTFVSTPTGGLNPGSGEFVKNVSRLDGSISYAINENLTLAADVSNILGKPFRNFRQVADGVVYPRDVRFEERVFSTGIRFRF